MGSPLGPTIANFFIANTKNKIQNNADFHPKLYLRYVDNIFCVFNNETSSDRFLDLLNKQHKNIKITAEHGSETLPFLDVEVTITESGIETKIYRKQTHTNLLLNFNEICYWKSYWKPMNWKSGLCKSFVNEYCHDSKQYLEDITYWKATKKYQNDNILYIVAGDVKALYPSVPRLLLVKKALTFVLKCFSQYTDAAVEILVNIALFGLDNVIIQYKDSFFTQKNGIVTGDNHSVSLANIALHYLILPISSTINQSVLLKRYIDDIIWLSYGLDTTTTIKQALICEFQKYDLELSFRDINTSENNAGLEFLDVEHKIDSNFASGFYTRNFVKPTAINRTFLNGKSFHPQHIFKSIVFSESIRLRRLNESQSEYLKSLECLRKNVSNLISKPKLLKKIISLASTWTNRFKPNKTSETKTENFKHRIVWATSFPNFFKLEACKLHIVSNANIVFKRPPTLFNIITNYKVIAHNLSIQKNDEGLMHFMW